MLLLAITVVVIARGVSAGRILWVVIGIILGIATLLFSGFWGKMLWFGHLGFIGWY